MIPEACARDELSVVLGQSGLETPVTALSTTNPNAPDHRQDLRG